MAVIVVRAELALEGAVTEFTTTLKGRRAVVVVHSCDAFTLIRSLAVFAEANTAIAAIEIRAVHRRTRDAPARIPPRVTARQTLFEPVAKAFIIADIISGEVHTLASACKTFIARAAEAIGAVFRTSLAIACVLWRVIRSCVSTTLSHARD